MRYILPLSSLAVTILAVFAAMRPSSAGPSVKVEDPWTGSYSKFGEFEPARTGQVGEAPKITITKEGDVYKLSKPYDLYQFKEVRKGILEDDKGVLGHLALGSMEFGDGRRARVLRAGFCYESFYLVGRLDEGKKPAAPTTPERKSPRLKVGEAEKLVRDLIFIEKPTMNPTAQFPLKDITTKAVWDRLGAQVFQVTEGVQACESFFIKAKKVYRIGQGFGGHGVTSMAVADPDVNGRDKLIFTYSWGSGIHRSHVAVFDCLAKEPVQVVAPLAYFGDLGDVAVKSGEGQQVDVFVGKQKVGRLVLAGKVGQLKVTIQFDDDLPQDVKKGFK